jgi:hypothetical protein
MYLSLNKLDLFNTEILIAIETEKDLCLKNYKLFDMEHSNVCTLILMNQVINPLYYQEYIDK